MRKLTTALLIISCFILQCTVFHGLAFAGIVPNLMIILTASLGLMRGEREGLTVGFFCGLLVDIFSGEMLGFYALVMMYIGFLNGKFNRIFFPEDIKLPLALILISDLTYGTICYIFLFLLRGRFDFGFYFTGVILPETVYTLVITMLLYPVILKINNKLEAREKRRAQKFV